MEMRQRHQNTPAVRRAASSRLQIWSSTTTPSTRHSLKCYTINARSRGNRSASAQDQDNSDSEASQRNLVDQNGSGEESYVEGEDGSDSASDELEPPRRPRRATPPAGSMDLDAQNARHCVRRLHAPAAPPPTTPAPVLAEPPPPLPEGVPQPPANAMQPVAAPAPAAAAPGEMDVTE